MFRVIEIAGACDSSDLDGNTILVGSEFGNNEYVFVSGLENIKFGTHHEIIGFMSLMDDYMIPTAKAIGEKEHIFLI